MQFQINFMSNVVIITCHQSFQCLARHGIFHWFLDRRLWLQSWPWKNRMGISKIDGCKLCGYGRQKGVPWEMRMRSCERLTLPWARTRAWYSLLGCRGPKELGWPSWRLKMARYAHSRNLLLLTLHIQQNVVVEPCSTWRWIVWDTASTLLL